MPPVGFEPTISAGEQPQTYALDRAATGTGLFSINVLFLFQTSQKFSWDSAERLNFQVLQELKMSRNHYSVLETETSFTLNV